MCVCVCLSLFLSLSLSLSLSVGHRRGAQPLSGQQESSNAPRQQDPQPQRKSYFLKGLEREERKKEGRERARARARERERLSGRILDEGVLKCRLSPAPISVALEADNPLIEKRHFEPNLLNRNESREQRCTCGHVCVTGD